MSRARGTVSGRRRRPGGGRRSGGGQRRRPAGGLTTRSQAYRTKLGAVPLLEVSTSCRQAGGRHGQCRRSKQAGERAAAAAAAVAAGGRAAGPDTPTPHAFRNPGHLSVCGAGREGVWFTCSGAPLHRVPPNARRDPCYPTRLTHWRHRRLLPRGRTPGRCPEWSASFPLSLQLRWAAPRSGLRLALGVPTVYRMRHSGRGGCWAADAGAAAAAATLAGGACRPHRPARETGPSS